MRPVRVVGPGTGRRHVDGRRCPQPTRPRTDAPSNRCIWRVAHDSGRSARERATGVVLLGRLCVPALASASDHLTRASGRTLAVSLNFERSGSGEPLILLHGIGGELCVWEPVLEPLARRMDVIAVDLPGFGRSPALSEGVMPTPFALADAIAGLMAELGIDSAHVAGNSLGGWVALELGKTDRARSVTALCPAGLWGAPLRRAGAPARGGAQQLARGLRPVLPLRHAQPPCAPAGPRARGGRPGPCPLRGRPAHGRLLRAGDRLRRHERGHARAPLHRPRADPRSADRRLRRARPADTSPAAARPGRPHA